MTTLKIPLEGFSKQIDFIHDTTPFIAAIAGTGGGKTEAGAIKALLFILNTEPGLFSVTAPTYKVLQDATLRTYKDKVFPPDLQKEFNKTEMRLELITGDEIIFRSTEDPDLLRGPNIKGFHMDEAALSPYEAFLILQARLRQGSSQQGWLTTTPKGYNWVYQVFGPDTVADNADYSLHKWSARDNCFLPADFIRHLEESYRDEFAMQEIEGEFVVVSGKCLFELAALRGMLNSCIKPIEERGNGLVKIYKKSVVGRRYAAGIDLGEGNGGNYSVAIILDCTTLETVAVLRSNILHQDMFAYEFSKLYEEYYKPFYVPESNVGMLFADKALGLGCSNLFYDDGEKKKKKGFKTTRVNKPIVWGLLEEAVRNREIIIWDRDAVSEMFSFIREGDKLEAQEGAHDDCVDALALALKAAREVGPRKAGKAISLMRPARRAYL